MPVVTCYVDCLPRRGISDKGGRAHHRGQSVGHRPSLVAAHYLMSFMEQVFAVFAVLTILGASVAYWRTHRRR